MKPTRRILLAAIIVPAFLAISCNKVTPENYEKIETGMTSAQVEKILGKGTEQGGGGVAVGDLKASAKTVVWEKGDKTITVSFANDQVVMKTKSGFWSKPGHPRGGAAAYVFSIPDAKHIRRRGGSPALDEFLTRTASQVRTGRL